MTRTCALGISVVTLAIVLGGCAGTTNTGINDPYGRAQPNGMAANGTDSYGGKTVTNPRDTKAAGKANSVAFDLAKALKLGAGGHNEMVSPLSVNQLLSMVLNGVEGPTHKALQTTLHVGDMPLEQLNAANAALVTQTESVEGSQLVVSNAIWSRPPLKPGEEFAKAMKSTYSAEIGELSSAGPEAVKQINDWVTKKTKERIKTLFDKLGDSDKLILVNALTFDGLWSKPFDPKDTKDQAFKAASGSKQVEMMNLDDVKAPYAEIDGIQAVSLDYAGGAYRMVFVIPPKGKTAAKYVEGLTSDKWTSVITALASKEGSVAIPKFKFESKYDLVQPLKSMGAGDLFKTSMDFSKMLGGKNEAVISQVVHKTFIEVDEKGTKAAAATGAAVSVTAMPMPQARFKFVADRPFVFVLTDVRTGGILFLGVINDPTGK